MVKRQFQFTSKSFCRPTYKKTVWKKIYSDNHLESSTSTIIHRDPLYFLSTHVGLPLAHVLRLSSAHVLGQSSAHVLGLSSAHVHQHVLGLSTAQVLGLSGWKWMAFGCCLFGHPCCQAAAAGGLSLVMSPRGLQAGGRGRIYIGFPTQQGGRSRSLGLPGPQPQWTPQQAIINSGLQPGQKGYQPPSLLINTNPLHLVIQMYTKCF